MKILRVGDPHVQILNLKDSEKIIDLVIKEAIKHKVDRVEFMGDLFHTHAIVRIEVMDFWRRAFKRVNDAGFSILTLVGNHDQPGSKEKEGISALDVLESMEDVKVITEVFQDGGVTYAPYMSDHDKFLKQIMFAFENGSKKCLIAHQNFTDELFGDKIEMDLVPQEQIISGHIHDRKQVGKCFNLGTPKWDSLTDANKEKGIWIFDHEKDGSYSSKTFISTRDIVTPINKYVIQEGEEVPKLTPGAKNYIEFHGKTAWISKMKKKYKGKAQIKGKPVDRKIGNIDKDKSLSLTDFLNKHFEPVENVKKEEIDHYLKEVT